MAAERASVLRLVSLQVITHRRILKTSLLVAHCAQGAMYHAVHAALHCVHLACSCDELHEQPLLLLLRFAPASRAFTLGMPHLLKKQKGAEPSHHDQVMQEKSEPCICKLSSNVCHHKKLPE